MTGHQAHRLSAWPYYCGLYTVYGIVVWVTLTGAAYLGNYSQFGGQLVLEITLATLVAICVLALVRTLAEVSIR